MSATAEIRAKLPLCGRCKNCKILVWTKEAKNSELKPSATIIKIQTLAITLQSAAIG